MNIHERVVPKAWPHLLTLGSRPSDKKHLSRMYINWQSWERSCAVCLCNPMFFIDLWQCRVVRVYILTKKT